MTFNPFDGRSRSDTAKSREMDLIRAVFSTPQGKELLAIWKHKLIYSPIWNHPEPEEVSRHKAGRHSVYRDIITISERKPDERRSKGPEPTDDKT
jgi:hypothetical protein